MSSVFLSCYENFYGQHYPSGESTSETIKDIKILDYHSQYKNRSVFMTFPVGLKRPRTFLKIAKVRHLVKLKEIFYFQLFLII